MRSKSMRLLCLLLAVMTALAVLPVSAADCAHSYVRKYHYQNSSQHSYETVCTKCGTAQTAQGSAGWENHTFDTAGKCTKCGYSRVCTHSVTVKKYENISATQHRTWTKCSGCGIEYYFVTESHSYKSGTWTQYSAAQHKRVHTCPCGASNTEYAAHTFSGGTCTVCGYKQTVSCAHTGTVKTYTAVNATSHRTDTACAACGKAIASATENHVFSGNSCTKCGYTKTAAQTASVKLSASSAAGKLGSAGGEIAAEGAPASYTVTASATGCTVTRIVYTQSGKTYSVKGSSVTIRAATENDFRTTTFTAYTDIDGVTATFTVNHKIVRHGAAYIMWETSNAAVIRSITGNGMSRTMAYPMTIPNSYDGQANLTEEQIAAIQNLIGVSDGKTYTVHYTRTVRVYTPAQYSETGERIEIASFDGNVPSEIETCVTTWGWGDETKAAIRQAASSYLTFTTQAAADCMAVWTDEDSGAVLYTKKFGEGLLPSSSSRTVSVNYTEYPGHADYEFVRLTYSGDSSGTGTAPSFSTTLTASSGPLTVTFHCRKPAADTGVTVYARDGETGALLPGVTVTGGGKSGTTNTTGGVLFGGLPAGTYTFTGTKDGYLPGSGTVKVGLSDPAVTVTVYLTPDSGGEEETGSYGVTVTVRSVKDQSAISGATVTYGTTVRTTGHTGTCYFSGTGSGVKYFRASKAGYIPNTGTCTVPAGSDGNLTIWLREEESASGGGAETGEEPQSGCTVTLYVRDAGTNALLRGAEVEGCGMTLTTAETGYARFSGIPAGRYTFTGRVEGYSDGTAVLTASAVTPDRTGTIYLTKKPAGKTISARVQVYVVDDATGDPLPGASVTYDDTAEGGTKTETANLYGSCRLYYTKSGTYTVTAEKAGYEPGSGTVTVSEQKNNETLTIRLKAVPAAASGSITVTVRAADSGAGIGNASVSWNGTAAVTDASGHVTFSPAAFGDYRITASAGGYENGETSVSVTAELPDARAVITLGKRTSGVNISVAANGVDGTVYRGSEIMVSAVLTGDASTDFTPSSPVAVTVTARSGRSVIRSERIPVICPKGETNLVWFAFTVPASGAVTVTFEAAPPDDVTEETTADNTAVLTLLPVELPARSTPAAVLALSAPDGFSAAVRGTESAPSKTWSVWEWENGFVRKTYSASLTAAASLTPDGTAVWKKQNADGSWTTRSGYGLDAAVTVSCAGLPAGMLAGHAKVNAYYPEYGYTASADRSGMLLCASEDTAGYRASFTFAPESGNIGSSKMHKTPVWFPDGEYAVSFEVYDLWTPAGSLRAVTPASVTIEGSLYDDYYTSRG